MKKKKRKTGNECHRIVTGAVALLLVVVAFVDTDAQERTLAVTNALIYPVSSPPIEDGVLIVRDGRIVAVGENLPVPEGARILNVEGRTVMPGLIESHSHMGFKQLNIPATGTNNNELSTPINAEVRAIDGLNSNDAAFSLALAAGVTTMNITTGSRSPNSGQAVVVKLRGGTVEDMFLAHGGMKFAIRADRQFENFPASVDEVKELLASRLRAARDYLDRHEAAEASATKPPPRDLELEALGKLLTREWVVGVHAHNAYDMRHAIALKKEFDLDLYIHHANGTLELAEELAAESIAVSFGPILPFRGRENPELAGPVRLIELGGRVAFHQDHPDGHQYFLRHSASLFVRKGMSKEEALKALTLYPATLFHLEERIGTLEPSKDADFLVLSGPPLDFESLVERVFIDGVEVYDRVSGTNVFGQRVPEGW
jgi:imidazolonepropionase-like amidohydrolase